MTGPALQSAPVRPVPPVRGLPELGRCRVMGVLNVTPDSFSDGGRYLRPAAALRRGRRLLADGADLLDVGGESTRPGAERISVAEEWRRVEPVLTGLAAAGAVVSIDTTRAAVAAQALAAGARLVNDVSGGLADPEMAEVIAETGTPYIVMHWRGPSRDMTTRAVYRDVVGEVTGELAARIDTLVAAGVARDQLIIDPGLGFAKTAAHNWALLAGLDALTELGRPVCIGASRKSFLGSLLGPPGEPRPAAERDNATAAVTAVLAERGAWCVRVHDAARNADAVRVAAALRAARVAAR